MSPRLLFGSLACLALLAAALDATPSEAAGNPRCPSASLPVVAVVSSDMSSCEVTTQNVEVDGFVVPIPPVNGSVSLHALYARSSRTLRVERSAQGVTIIAEGFATDGTDAPQEPDAVVVDGIGDKPYEAPSEELTVVSAPRACDDKTFNTRGYKEADVLHWRYNSANRSNRWLGNRYDLTDIRRGNTNMTRGNNNCGKSEGAFSSTGQYDGSTSRKANISTSYGETTCGADDEHSVVSWRNIGAFAQACVWASAGDVKHADIEISNSTSKTWFSIKPKSCTGAKDLESVMTHEWGHAFGLNHVDEEAHGNLTMSPITPRCSTSPRTLGTGDWLGMSELYG